VWLVIQLLLWLYDWSGKIGCEVGCNNVVLGVCWSCVFRALIGPILIVTFDYNPGFDGCTLFVRLIYPEK